MLKYLLVSLLLIGAVSCKYKHVFQSQVVREIMILNPDKSNNYKTLTQKLSKADQERINREMEQEMRRIR